MFKIPEASRGLVKSFAQACLNLRHNRPDNILIHLSQRLLSPGVNCDSTLSQLGFSTSLAPFLSGNQKKSSKSRMFTKYDWPSITAWTVVVGFFSHQGHELPTRLLDLLQLCISSQASTVGSLAFSEVRFGKFYFIILQPFSFERSLNISLVNSQFFFFFFFFFFCQADSIIVHCRIDKLLPLPLVRFTAGRPLASYFSVAPQCSKFWRTL